MEIYFVNQGKNYEIEHEGGYLWAPDREKQPKEIRGEKTISKGHTNVMKVKKGDIIIHNRKATVVDISRANCDAFEATRPEGTKNYDSDEDGFRVNITSIGDITPVSLKALYPEMDKRNKERNITQDCAVTAKRAKQLYLSVMSEGEIEVLIQEIVNNQTSEKMRNKIIDLFGDDGNDYIHPKISKAVDIADDYSSKDLEVLNRELVMFSDSAPTTIQSEPQKQVYYTVKNTKEKKPYRDLKNAQNALYAASYKCEIDPKDLTFERKNGIPYTEPHHLIPICYCDDFEYSLDDPANIVSLCSHHHNQIHYGKNEDKIKLLKKLWDNRKAKLKDRNIYIDFDKLLEYYNIEH